MRFGAIALLLFSSGLLMSQERIGRMDETCASGIAATGEAMVDSVINLKILLVQFSDVNCRMDSDGVTPRYSAGDFEEMLGSYGVYVSPARYSPDGDPVYGSMNDFFRIMSGGRMSVRASVINRRDPKNGRPVWLTLKETKQFYQLYQAAIFGRATDLAYASGLDPSLSGNDRLAIVYAGNTYFLGGGLNPQESQGQYIMSELQGRPYNQENPDARFARIGIHCHEFAHTIGVGHTTGGRADLMCGGDFSGSVEGNAPAPLNGIARVRLGWADLVPVETLPPEGVDIGYSLDHPTVYLMKNGSGDLFYIENRRFDQTMTIGSTVVPDYNNVAFFAPAQPHHLISQGLLVWRVNAAGDSRDPGYSTEGLVYASGRYGRTYPENQLSDTDDGVPFPGVSNNRFLFPSSDARSPYIKEMDYFGGNFWHYTLYVPNTKGGSSCGMEIVSEDKSSGTFHVRFYGANVPNPALAAVPVPDSLGAYEARRTVVRDSLSIHQVMEAGGEVFYRRSWDNGSSWSAPRLLSQGNGGNCTASIAIAGKSFIAVWQMDAYDAADSGRTVYFSRSTDHGLSWSAYNTVGWSYRCGRGGAYPTVAGSIDGRAMIVYRADRSVMNAKVSTDEGQIWLDASPVPVEEIEWTASSLQMDSTGVIFAWAADSLSRNVHMSRYASGAWGTPEELSSVIPIEYSRFSRPSLIGSRVTWDAREGASGERPVIISRDIEHPGSSYSVINGRSQDDFSWRDLNSSLDGRWGKSYSRILSLIEPAGGADVSVEITRMTVARRNGIDSVHFAAAPAESLMIDASGLMKWGETERFRLVSGEDTLAFVSAIYGTNSSALFSEGRIGFEIVLAGTDSVLERIAVTSSGSVGSRRLVRISVPGLPSLAEGRDILLRPFVEGLRSDIRTVAALANVYSDEEETPAASIVSSAIVRASSHGLPGRFSLEQNYPNPFNPSTTISFSIAAKAHVSLIVYNTLGQEVASLLDSDVDAGRHEVRLDGTRLASGAYFYMLRAGGNSSVKKCLLLK